MPQTIIRPVRREEFAEWHVLWDAYNAFYGRSGATALADAITAQTWERLFDPAEPVFSLVAEHEGALVGLTNYLFHRSTSRPSDVCYLQDLFTAEHFRGRGVGGQLIEAVFDAAAAAGCSRVYWQTHKDNATARALYDRLAEHKGFVIYARDL